MMSVLPDIDAVTHFQHRCSLLRETCVYMKGCVRVLVQIGAQILLFAKAMCLKYASDSMLKTQRTRSDGDIAA